MAILDILVYPDPRLRRVAQPVTEFDGALQRLVADMAETMYADGGIGLAAAQVNVAQRVVVMDLSENHDRLQVFINPELSAPQGTIEIEEGCLSVPGVTVPVQRAERVHIRARDVHGDAFEMDAEQLLSVCIQHEIDHLDGKLLVDYMSRLKRERLRKKLKKHAREHPAQAA